MDVKGLSSRAARGLPGAGAPAQDGVDEEELAAEEQHAPADAPREHKDLRSRFGPPKNAVWAKI